MYVWMKCNYIWPVQPNPHFCISACNCLYIIVCRHLTTLMLLLPTRMNGSWVRDIEVCTYIRACSHGPIPGDIEVDHLHMHVYAIYVQNTKENKNCWSISLDTVVRKCGEVWERSKVRKRQFKCSMKDAVLSSAPKMPNPDKYGEREEAAKRSIRAPQHYQVQPSAIYV